MTPDETRRVLELVDRLQALVITLVSDAMNGRDPLPTALSVQSVMNELRDVAKASCES